MDPIKLLLSERARFQRALDKIVDEDIEGSLVISKNGGKRYFYQRKVNGVFKRSYIKAENIEFIKLLAGKAYYLQAKKFLIRRIKNLDLLIEDYKKNSLEKIYYKQSPERRELIEALELSKEQKIAIWKSKKYQPNTYDFYDFEIKTKKGERVRSKSEKILADMFFDYGLEYKYECPLYLANRIIYPDFTFYNPITEEEIYWEHFGKMDDEEYLHKAINKIEVYLLNGMKLGQRFLFTFETSKKNLDYDTVHMLIRKHLIF